MPLTRKSALPSSVFPAQLSARFLPRYDNPLPLWIIFPLIFAALYLTHASLLRLPYYWDEAGYYIPAAYDFFRTGSLIPVTTLSNAHPPLPSIYLALWWKLAGFTPLVTRTAVCLVASVALLAVYRLAHAVTRRTPVAAATVALTALYPVWFAQSTLAHADIFAAAATLWGLAFALEDTTAPRTRARPLAAVLCFSLAALAKETAIVTPLALALWETWHAWRLQFDDPASGSPRPRLAAGGRYLLVLLPLIIWYAYHYSRTGYVFGNPEYLRYNATATLSPLRFAVALFHRTLHVTTHMNMFVPVLCALAAMLLPPRDEQDGSPRQPIGDNARQQVYLVIVANVVFFSVMGGALLTRYVLPVYPLVLLICVNTLRRRVLYWPALVALSGAAFFAGLIVNPPYGFAPEDNLAYADVIALHQQAIRVLVERNPHSVVLTAWPASDELTKPELGYLRTPFPVVVIDNFSLLEIQRAAQAAPGYTTALLFSTKYDPPGQPLSMARKNDSIDSRFFDFHRDLRPDAAARVLGGAVEWRRERKGLWAAVLHFDRPQLAQLPAPSTAP
ncbi:MAG TPA: glycosyltransferase family 39 protein [Acidisarcina sp.]